MQLFLQHLFLALVYKVTFQNRNSGLLRRIVAVMTLLWAFEHSRHAEIKTIQKLSTVTSRAADVKCQKISNRRTRAATQIRWLVAGFSLRKTGFDPGEVQVGSAMGKLTTVVFLPPLRYSLVKYHSTNDPYSFIYHPVGGPLVQDMDLWSKTVSPHHRQRPDARPFGNHNVRTTTN